MCAASTPSAVAPAIVAPETPALTAAATAAAPASATPVLCVTRLAMTTWSTSVDRLVRPGRGAGSRATAMPTGAMRIAAPLVVPKAPASSGGVPARMAATARLVEGPSRSREPRSAMSRSQSMSAAASSSGSSVPWPLTRSLASRTACSVSSVTDPAGMPLAMGCPGGAGSKPGRSGPQRCTISARDSICVGMPSASPIASPYSAPRARAASEDVAAVHFAEGVGEQFQAGAVGVAEVQRRPAFLEVLHAGRVEVGPQRVPLLPGHRDREVVQAAEDLGVRAEVQAGEVEESQQVAVPDVEEEVVGP